MTPNPLLSIIVPVYNAGEYLSPCILSILNNDYQNFELILVLDEPTDGSDRICQEFASTDSRIKIISIPHSGVSAARNRGIEESNGEWISFIDADDTIWPNRFTDTINAAYANDVKLVTCGICTITNGQPGRCMNIYAPIIWTFGETRFNFHSLCTNFIYDAHLIKDNNIRFSDCNYGEDSLFAAEAFFLAEKLYNIDVPLYNLTRGHMSLSSSELTNERIEKLFNATYEVLKKYVGTERFMIFKNLFLPYLFCRPPFRNYINENYMSLLEKFWFFDSDDLFK